MSQVLPITVSIRDQNCNFVLSKHIIKRVNPVLRQPQIYSKLIQGLKGMIQSNNYFNNYSRVHQIDQSSLLGITTPPSNKNSSSLANKALIPLKGIARWLKVRNSKISSLTQVQFIQIDAKRTIYR